MLNLSVFRCSLSALVASQPCYILAMWPCPNRFTSLIQNIVICKNRNMASNKTIMLSNPNVTATFFFFVKRSHFKNWRFRKCYFSLCPFQFTVEKLNLFLSSLRLFEGRRCEPSALTWEGPVCLTAPQRPAVWSPQTTPVTRSLLHVLRFVYVCSVLFFSRRPI